MIVKHPCRAAECDMSGFPLLFLFPSSLSAAVQDAGVFSCQSVVAAGQGLVQRAGSSHPHPRREAKGKGHSGRNQTFVSAVHHAFQNPLALAEGMAADYNSLHRGQMSQFMLIRLSAKTYNRQTSLIYSTYHIQII